MYMYVCMYVCMHVYLCSSTTCATPRSDGMRAQVRALKPHLNSADKAAHHARKDAILPNQHCPCAHALITKRFDKPLSCGGDTSSQKALQLHRQIFGQQVPVAGRRPLEATAPRLEPERSADEHARARKLISDCYGKLISDHEYVLAEKTIEYMEFTGQGMKRRREAGDQGHL